MTTRLGTELGVKLTKVVNDLLERFTRLAGKVDDFHITYQFLDDEHCLRLEIRPSNEWSTLAFKTIHDTEIADEVKSLK